MYNVCRLYMTFDLFGFQFVGGYKSILSAFIVFILFLLLCIIEAVVLNRCLCIHYDALTRAAVAKNSRIPDLFDKSIDIEWRMANKTEFERKKKPTDTTQNLNRKIFIRFLSMFPFFISVLYQLPLFFDHFNHSHYSQLFELLLNCDTIPA